MNSPKMSWEFILASPVLLQREVPGSLLFVQRFSEVFFFPSGQRVRWSVREWARHGVHVAVPRITHKKCTSTMLCISALCENLNMGVSSWFSDYLQFTTLLGLTLLYRVLSSFLQPVYQRLFSPTVKRDHQLLVINYLFISAPKLYLLAKRDNHLWVKGA